MTPEDVDRIAAIADPVIRNVRITQAYHDLSNVTAARLGPAANWCTYATWASKQAGRTIRKEDLGRALDAAVGSSPSTEHAATEVAAEAVALGAAIPPSGSLAIVSLVVDPAMSRASAAVAREPAGLRGDRPRVARFEAQCGEDMRVDARGFARFVDGLRPGDPPVGQRYLRQAFSRYQQARFEADPVVRAQLILLANLEIGFHEQTRLQPDIAEALDAGVLDHVMCTIASSPRCSRTRPGSSGSVCGSPDCSGDGPCSTAL